MDSMMSAWAVCKDFFFGTPIRTSRELHLLAASYHWLSKNFFPFQDGGSVTEKPRSNSTAAQAGRRLRSPQALGYRSEDKRVWNGLPSGCWHLRFGSWGDHWPFCRVPSARRPCPHEHCSQPAAPSLVLVQIFWYTPTSRLLLALATFSRR